MRISFLVVSHIMCKFLMSSWLDFLGMHPVNFRTVAYGGTSNLARFLDVNSVCRI